MKSFLLFVLLGCGFCVQAQDLTGIWRGNFRQTPAVNSGRPMDFFTGANRYKFEVQIDQRNKEFKGVTYSYLSTVFYGKATCQGAVDPDTKLISLDELKIVEVRMMEGSGACIMTLSLKYSKEDDGGEFLQGTYTSKSTKNSSNCGTGTVFLRKVTTSDFYEEPFLVKREKEKQKVAEKPVIKKDTAAKKPVIAKTTTPKTTAPVKKPVTGTAKPPVTKNVDTKPKPNVKIVATDTVKKVEIKPNNPITTIPIPKALSSRENELVKTITTNVNEVLINIYDNGTVDNDTVSVYLDKKLVLSKKRLTEKAISLTVNLDADENYHELVMVAENLGEFPPNTSLMVVKAGAKQYEVRITSTEQKNAVIVFKYEK